MSKLCYLYLRNEYIKTNVGVVLLNEILTSFAISAQMSPFVFANAFEITPQFYAFCAVLTFIRLTRWLTVFDDFREMNRHVTVYV